ncbi:MAG: hypothetical protein AAF483_24495, partial [Planctomycetota bacterium]
AGMQHPSLRRPKTAAKEYFAVHFKPSPLANDEFYLPTFRAPFVGSERALAICDSLTSTASSTPRLPPIVTVGLHVFLDCEGFTS